MGDALRLHYRMTRDHSVTRIATDMHSYTRAMQLVLEVLHGVPREWRVLIVMPHISHFTAFWAPLDTALHPGDTLYVRQRLSSNRAKANPYATKPDIVYVNSTVPARHTFDLVVFANPDDHRRRPCTSAPHVIIVDLLHDTTPFAGSSVIDVRALDTVDADKRLWTVYTHPCALQCAMLEPKQWPATQTADTPVGSAKKSSMDVLTRFLLQMLLDEKAAQSRGASGLDFNPVSPVGHVRGVRIVVVFSDPSCMYAVSTPLALNAVPMTEVLGETLTPCNVRELAGGRINIVFVHHTFRDLAALVTSATSIHIADSLVAPEVLRALYVTAHYKPVMLWRVDTRDAQGRALYVEGPFAAQYITGRATVEAAKREAEPNGGTAEQAGGREAEPNGGTAEPSSEAEGREAEPNCEATEQVEGREAKAAKGDDGVTQEKKRVEGIHEAKSGYICRETLRERWTNDLHDAAIDAWDMSDVPEHRSVALLVEGVELDLCTISIGTLADIAHAGLEFQLCHGGECTPPSWLASFVLESIINSLPREQRYATPMAHIDRAAVAPLWTTLCAGRPGSLSPVDWSALTTLMLCQLLTPLDIHIGRDKQGEPWVASLVGSGGSRVPVYNFFNSAALRAPQPVASIQIN